MLKNGILSAASALLLAANCAAANTEGASGAQFLRIGVGAKASALGETGAVSAGAQSMFYNPAGLTDIKNAEASFSQVQWVQDINYSNLALAKKAGAGVYGLAVNYLSVPSTAKYDKFGNKLSDVYSAADMAVALGYARRLDARTGLGLDLKYISSRLETESASALAIDAGIKYELIPEALTLGFAVQNLGTQLKYRSKGDPLPLNLKLGGRYLFNLDGEAGMKNKLAVFTDLNDMRDSGVYLNLGLELKMDYSQGSAFSIRGGYRTNSGNKSAGASLGLGVEMKTYEVDYSYSPMGDLGKAHRLSLTVKFDGGA